MAPTAAATKPKEDSNGTSDYGIRAVLLGPPGAGKGTQVGAMCYYLGYIALSISYIYKSSTKMQDEIREYFEMKIR